MEIVKIIFYIIIFISVFSFFSLAPWVPTKRSDLARINEIIKLKPWEKFLEIGSWTAVVSIEIARKNPEAKIYWIELSVFLYLVWKLRAKLSGLKNVEIIYWNAMKIDFSEYDVVYVFWLIETISRKLYPKLEIINKKNFRFISYCFKFSNNKVFKETRYKIEGKNSIYEYKKS